MGKILIQKSTVCCSVRIVREKVNYPRAPMALLSAQDVVVAGLLKKKRKLLKRIENRRNITEPAN